MPRNAFYAQSGGVTAVINASAAGVIETARKHKKQIGRVYADTCLKVSQLAEKMGYPLTAVHVPKTVDNDLPITDCCPGFGSVAKYVATSMLEAGFDVESMAKTSTKVFIMEVMGRHAGWITAAMGLAQSKPGTAPHILLFPEIPFEEEAFLAAVKRNVDQHGYCAVGVSEGLHDKDGKFLAESGLKDAFGHSQLGGVAPRIAELVRGKLDLKHHWAVADYLQRSARHIASKTDLDQAYAVGKAAVELALKGMNAMMPVIQRTSDAPYRWKIAPAKLEDIANHEKTMPANFLRKDGYGITAAARRYLEPLIRGEAPPPYGRDGLPKYVVLKNAAVKKKLT